MTVADEMLSTIPAVSEVRVKLAENLHERDALRQLLKLAESLQKATQTLAEIKERDSL